MSPWCNGIIPCQLLLGPGITGPWALRRDVRPRGTTLAAPRSGRGPREVGRRTHATPPGGIHVEFAPRPGRPQLGASLPGHHTSRQDTRDIPTREDMATQPSLADFGRIDIYLFDQLLRGRITPRMRILDAGCGEGRNVEYLLRCGAHVHGVDRDPDQVRQIRELASRLHPDLPEEHFQVADLSHLPFPDRSFDVVICNAVLHFAADGQHFRSMVDELWRVLDRGGILFCRLASTIGMGERPIPLGGGWYHLPDGSDRFLVTEDDLVEAGRRLGGLPMDPLKTTVVQDMRAMTTWVLGKGAPSPGRVPPS